MIERLVCDGTAAARSDGSVHTLFPVAASAAEGEALRDWVGEGAASRFALEPDEVVARSAPRPPEASRAAACFELGQYLHRIGEAADAISWFRDAHRLAPGNWTYKRQAWEFLDPVLQGPSEQYDGDWLSDVRAIGAENYYPPVDL